MSRETPRRNRSTAILALVVALALLAAFVGAYRRYLLLASHGKGALATVISYEPRKSRYTKGTTTSHDHVLSFDGIVENVTLPRPQTPGTILRVVYLLESPQIVAMGTPGMSAWQLMGGDALWVLLAGLVGSGLLVFGVSALYRLRWDAAAAAGGER